MGRKQQLLMWDTDHIVLRTMMWYSIFSKAPELDPYYLK